MKGILCLLLCLYFHQELTSACDIAGVQVCANTYNSDVAVLNPGDLETYCSGSYTAFNNYENCINIAINDCDQETKDSMQASFDGMRNSYDQAMSQCGDVNTGCNIGVPADDNIDARSDLRNTVKVFGDPHIKAYDIADIITCKAPGPTNFLHNIFVSIDGTNTVAMGSSNSEATYMTQVAITFRDAQNAELARYAASNSLLPLEFVSGMTKVGCGDATVEISKTSYNRVMIKQVASGAAISLASQGGTYILVARFSESVLQGSTGILKFGCLDTIDKPSVTNRSEACTTACATIPAEFLETCEFDCGVTGDAELSTFQGEVSIMETEVEKLDAELSGAGSIWRLQQALLVISLAMIVTYIGFSV